MKALILIGGKGTRLRPFTCSTPKPLLPVLNVPFLHYQLRALKRHGIREAVLCVSHQAGEFLRALGGGRGLGLRLRYAREASPLGTGGAVRNAAAAAGGTVLVLNGDLLHDLDVPAFLGAHRRSRADASIALTRVKDPTQYGLVETDPSGRVRRFLEKPSWEETTCNTVNAGAYLFEPEAVRLIPAGVPYSLERGLFPQLLEAGRRLHGFVTKGYWIDIGTVDKYLQVHLDLLAGRAPFLPGGLRRLRGFRAAPGARVSRRADREGSGEVVLGAGARVADYARFVGSACVGPRCRIGRGAVLEDCVVLAGARIGEGARLERCVVGPGCSVGAHAVLGPGRALGDGSSVSRFSQL